MQAVSVFPSSAVVTNFSNTNSPSQNADNPVLAGDKCNKKASHIYNRSSYYTLAKIRLTKSRRKKITVTKFTPPSLIIPSLHEGHSLLRASASRKESTFAAFQRLMSTYSLLPRLCDANLDAPLLQLLNKPQQASSLQN